MSHFRIRALFVSESTRSLLGILLHGPRCADIIRNVLFVSAFTNYFPLALAVRRQLLVAWSAVRLPLQVEALLSIVLYDSRHLFFFFSGRGGVRASRRAVVEGVLRKVKRLRRQKNSNRNEETAKDRWVTCLSRRVKERLLRTSRTWRM